MGWWKAIILTGCFILSGEGGAANANMASATGSPAGPGSLAGIWLGVANWQNRVAQPDNLVSGRLPERDRVQHTADGEMPPLQPWAAELLDKRMRLSLAGNPEPLNMTQCLPGVPVLMLGGPYPLQILETPDQVTILFEEQTHFRIIHLNGRHPDDPDPTFMGHSIGHWEDDTLVVDTVALSERTTIDRIGIPHSDALHLVERFRRTGRDTLDVTTTIDDAKTFTRSWDTKTTFRTVPEGVGLTEYICENNREMAKRSGP